MPEVASVFTGAQIGPETTPGTSVAASKLLRYFGLEPSPNIGFNRFQPMGQLVAGAITPGQDFTEWALTGQGSYGEMMVLFASLLVDTTPATIETTARRWTFTPAARTEDTPQTYTVESGSSTRAQKATYVLANAAEITFNRTEGVTITGSAFGQQLQDNIALTATPTQYGDKPILPTHLDIYVDTTSAGIGVTKLTRDFNAVFRVSDRWGPIWPINSANASFPAHVVTNPTFQIELTCAADSQGMGFLTDARAASTKYVRLAAVSTENAGASSAKYDVLIDMACKVSNVAGFDDTEGVKTWTVTLDAVYDASWGSGQFMTARVTNQEANI